MNKVIGISRDYHKWSEPTAPASGFERITYGLRFHSEATRGMLRRRIGRRSQERYALNGTHPMDWILHDRVECDAALGSWFHGFLSRWTGPCQGLLEAAE